MSDNFGTALFFTEFYIMYKSKLTIRWIVILLFALVVAFIGFSLSLSDKSASAYYENDNDIHTEWYYAESAVSAGFAYNSDFSTDINNSSAVLSKTYYIEINARTYDQLSSNYNHLVISWGRKAEMDILANNCKSDSKTGDPSFSLRLDDISNILVSHSYVDTDGDGYAEPVSGWDTVYNVNYKLYSEFQNIVNFPYVGYRVQQSNVIDDRGNGGSFWVPVTVTWAEKISEENTLFDIGIMLTFQYSATFGRDTYINAYYTDSTIVSDIQNRVRNASSYSQSVAGAYEKALGIYRSGNTTVNYTYLKMLDGHFNKYETITSSIPVPSVYVPDENYVWNRVLSCDYVNGKGLVGFNANYTSYAGFEMSNGGVGKKETFGSKIIREATGYTYSYSGDAIPETVSCNINYADYNYSNFYIRISNSGNPNVSEVEGYFPNNLLVDVYPTSVEILNGKYYLYFDYNHIITLFGNTLHWAVLQDYFSLSYNTSDIKAHVYVNEETVSAGHKRLAVSFDNGYKNNLFGLEITGNAPITEPVEMLCSVEYSSLDNDLVVSSNTFSAGYYYDNNLGSLAAELSSRDGAYANYIYDSINPAVLGGVEFLRPSFVTILTNYDNLTARLQVNYEYPSSVLVVTNNINTDKWVFSLPDTAAEYSLFLLGIQNKLPSGYRVSGFSSNRLIISERELGNEIKTKFYKGDSNRNEPYTIALNLTDKWPITINYLEQWKTSPFAIMNEFKGNIRVVDYPSDEYGNLALSATDISEILDRNIVVLNFLKVAVKIDEVNITYDEINDKYIVDLVYTHLSLLARDYSATAEEVKIALTPFSMWCDFYGKDWSPLWLNNEDHLYFTSVDLADISPERIYGFFSYVVFKDEVHDFSNWLREQTGGGVSVLYSVSEVKGSGFYKFLNETTGVFAAVGGSIGIVFGHPIVGATVGTLTHYGLTSIAEAINDENGTYYTYFFFLDGTTAMPWMTDTGATSRDDNDSAIKNRAQGVAEDVGDFFSKILESAGPVFTLLKFVLGALALLIIVLPIVKLIEWISSKYKRQERKRKKGK